MFKWIKKFIKKQIADWKAYSKEHEGDLLKKFLQDKFRNSPDKMNFAEMNAVIAKFGLTEHEYLNGKLYCLYNREVVYCPEDHRIGCAYGLYPDGIIDFEDEYTRTDKLEKFLMKKTKEIKDIKAEMRLILMKEDFD